MGIIADRVQKRLAVVASSDAEYLAAAEAGDIEACQRMVDAAAKAAGYTIGPVYHGTPTGGFTEFRKSGKRDSGWFGPALYFSKSKDVADMFRATRTEDREKGRKKTYSVYLKSENPFSIAVLENMPENKIRGILDARRAENGKEQISDEKWADYWTSLSKEVSAANGNSILIAKAWGELLLYPTIVAQNMGFDSIQDDAEGGTIAVFSPNQIKLSDPITRDDSGNIIPLSKRFNSASNDIRAAYCPRSPEESSNIAEEHRTQSLWGMEIQDALIRDGWVRKGTMTGAPQQITKNGGSAYFQINGAKIRLSDHDNGRVPYGYNVIDYTVAGVNLPVDEDHERRHFPPGTDIGEVLRWANGLAEGKGISASRHTMNLQEKYKALKAAGRISATGRTEEILAEDDWVRVKRMAVPEIEAESYLFMECKRETAVCIVRDADGYSYLMRNEATLQSNFTPVPKVMTETLEEGETAEQAVIRGLKEEFGVDPASDPIYLGSINGTFQELHNYHIYLVEGIEPSAADLNGDGDGSRGEERSNSINITEDEFAQVKDFISWIAYGMMKQRDDTNILGRL